MAAPIPVWTGVVTEDGHLRLDARALFQRYVRSLANKPIQLVLKRLGRPKSRVQLGYLFGVLYPVIAEGFGYREYEVPAVHDACMRKLRGLLPDPNPLQLRVSLRAFSHEMTADYIEDLRHWALTEHGIVTPDAQKAEVA